MKHKEFKWSITLGTKLEVLAIILNNEHSLA